ncbi:MAG TPA: carboxylating nicotinate-nucleotide diphosphorylase [Candidatus Nanopelagicaceae bacterium]
MSDHVTELIALAFAEDLAGGVDITSVATIPTDQESIAQFVTRSAGVIAGIPVAIEVFRFVGITDISNTVSDGQYVHSGTVILEARGNTRKLLLAERTALNFLTHLSGIATLTKSWVDAVNGTHCLIRDTRKTTPGWRTLEKAAVRAGGGTNHRLALSDAALIKDNHIVAAGGVLAAFELVRDNYPNAEIEVEVDTLDQLREVLVAKPDLILLDNMPPGLCRQAVEIVNHSVKLEASGGITLENARAYATSGVDYLSIGALTHSAPALDIGLDLTMGK